MFVCPLSEMSDAQDTEKVSGYRFFYDFLMIVAFEVLFGGKAQFFVPIAPETAYERFAQEFVQWDAEFLAQCAGVAADVPTVVVERGERHYIRQADGVKMARYRFFEACLPVAEGLFERA